MLTLADGSMAPFDYKFAEDRGRVYHNQKMQSVLYALLIRETFQCPVHRGFLCYIRSKHKVVPIEFSDADFAEAEAVLREILQVIQTGCFPKRRPGRPVAATAATEIFASSRPFGATGLLKSHLRPIKLARQCSDFASPIFLEQPMMARYRPTRSYRYPKLATQLGASGRPMTEIHDNKD